MKRRPDPLWFDLLISSKTFKRSYYINNIYYRYYSLFQPDVEKAMHNKFNIGVTSKDQLNKY